ncbi:MAG: hypothetical protein JSS83_24900 [Cyanobacteria bacterium SZAS LIN-3]|nr:hypothetical protein [Cyanobacteria bacterium SZAS LIN-3]
MIKEKLAILVQQAMNQAESADQIARLSPSAETLIFVRPREPALGDLSSALPLQLAAASQAGLQPMQAASIIASHLPAGVQPGDYLRSVEVTAPGFINFRLGEAAFIEVLQNIVVQGERYGLSEGGGLPPADAAPDPFVYQTYLFCRGVLRRVREPRVNILSGRLEEPILSVDQWMIFLGDIKDRVEIFRDVFSDSEKSPGELILKLDAFPRLAADARARRSNARLRRYNLSLAQELRRYCGQFNLGEGLFSPHLSVLKARLGLIFAARQVLSNSLGIIDL